MDRTSVPDLHPARLPPGTLIGPWCVQAWAGRGVYGAVYRAVPVGAENAAPVALKLALFPEDPRFAREVELLSRVDDPSIPRLLAHGAWRHPGGMLHPFVVMEWVDGAPLYDEVRRQPVSSQQVLRWLAQLAHALAALHAQGAIHRDVKGANILVRRSDGRAVLTDFGSGLYLGASILTPPMVFPGTPAYRSPEAWLFELRFYREPSARYCSRPADDLFALGVTACRLLTGEYPEPGEPSQDEFGTWNLESVLLPPALLSHPHLEPRLRALVLQMLSVRPEERGTASVLAAALKQAAEHPAPESLQPRFTGLPLPPSPVLPDEAAVTPGSESPGRLRSPTWPGQASLAVAAASLALTVWMWWAGPLRPQSVPSSARTEASEVEAPDANTSGLAEAAATTSREQTSSPPTQERVTASPLPEPVPGQIRPDEKGRCPSKGLIALNQGCWVEFAGSSEKCGDLGGQMMKGTCYVPFIPPGRRPSSSPMDKP